MDAEELCRHLIIWDEIPEQDSYKAFNTWFPHMRHLQWLLAQTRAAQAISERNRQNAKNKHHDTPKKNRLIAMVDMRTMTGHYAGNTTNQVLYDAAGVSRSAGKRTIASEIQSTRTYPHKDLPDWEET